jgi:poly(3-hydroxybutyrate) depolymerase
MPPFQQYPINMPTTRTYDVFVPPTPKQPLLPAIIVFHGGGEDIRVIEKNWGIDPPNPVPPMLAEYLLVFPETDPTLDDKWIHHKQGDKRIPEHDLLFLDALVNDLITRAFPAGAMGQVVSADPNMLYVAGFSSGAGMVWQIANSNRALQFKGYATVGLGLDPEKAMDFRQQLGGAPPPPIPLIYIMGTADSHFTSPTTLMEVPIQTSRPFHSVQEMIKRNGIPSPAVAATTLIPGSTNMTEVVAQLFTGGARAFSYVTVINGNHNWPTPASTGLAPIAKHINATEMIVGFWRAQAGLP